MYILLKVLKVFGIYFVVVSVGFLVVLVIACLVGSENDEPIDLTEDDEDYFEEQNRRADHWNEAPEGERKT